MNYRRKFLILLAAVAFVAACQNARPLIQPLSPLVEQSANYMPLVRLDATPTALPTQPPTPTPSFCEANIQAHEFAELLNDHMAQEHPSLVCHPVLVELAQFRAEDMATRNYFSHTDPDGKGPNFHARRLGYVLPSFYEKHDRANNIESISGGQTSAQQAFSTLLTSPPHRSHLLGETSFYRRQDCYGIGYARNDNAVFVEYWVAIIAPCS